MPKTNTGCRVASPAPARRSNSSGLKPSISRSTKRSARPGRSCPCLVAAQGPGHWPDQAGGGLVVVAPRRPGRGPGRRARCRAPAPGRSPRGSSSRSARARIACRSGSGSLPRSSIARRASGAGCAGPRDPALAIPVLGRGQVAQLLVQEAQVEQGVQVARAGVPGHGDNRRRPRPAAPVPGGPAQVVVRQGPAAAPTSGDLPEHGRASA